MNLLLSQPQVALGHRIVPLELWVLWDLFILHEVFLDTLDLMAT